MQGTPVLWASDCEGGPFHGRGDSLDVGVRLPERGSRSHRGSAWCQGQACNPLQGQLPQPCSSCSAAASRQMGCESKPQQEKRQRSCCCSFPSFCLLFCSFSVALFGVCSMKHTKCIIRPGMIAPGTGMGIAVAVANVEHLFLALPGMVHPRCVPR